MTTKLKIDWTHGVLEVEGEEAFVKMIYDEYKTGLSVSRPVVRTAYEESEQREGAPQEKATNSPSSLAAYETLGDVFGDIPNPRDLSNDERALVAAAHNQIKGATQSFGGRAVNKSLADVGYKAKKIVRDFETNMGMTPARIVQLRKNGTSQQAQKTYKVTTEGFKAVDKILAGTNDENTK